MKPSALLAQSLHFQLGWLRQPPWMMKNKREGAHRSELKQHIFLCAKVGAPMVDRSGIAISPEVYGVNHA